MSKYCPNCGDKHDENGIYCENCGYDLNNKNTIFTKKLEFILGILGGIFGSICSILILYFSVGIIDILPTVGIITLIASIIGIGGAVCIKFDNTYSGIILIISSIGVLYGFSMFTSFIATIFNSIWPALHILLFGLMGFIFFIIPGISVIIKK